MWFSVVSYFLKYRRMVGILNCQCFLKRIGQVKFNIVNFYFNDFSLIPTSAQVAQSYLPTWSLLSQNTYIYESLWLYMIRGVEGVGRTATGQWCFTEQFFLVCWHFALLPKFVFLFPFLLYFVRFGCPFLIFNIAYKISKNYEHT